MGCCLVERDDFAAAKQAPHLCLLRRATGLSEHWRRYQRHQARFEPNAVFGPNPALGTVGRDQDARVIDNGLHRGERFRRVDFGSMRARAAKSSAGVKAPCSASHSATAARPSRTRRARRAASVIHAETLFPSASAASSTLEWTSASTVTASFTAGFPLGIAEPYYHSSMVATWRRIVVHTRGPRARSRPTVRERSSGHR